MTEENVIRVDFRKKKKLSEDEVEVIPGFTRPRLEFAILKLNFICCFSDDTSEVSNALAAMAELTDAVGLFDWYADCIEFFEDFLAKNPYWHIKECKNKEKRWNLKEQYWRRLLKEWSAGETS